MTKGKVGYACLMAAALPFAAVAATLSKGYVTNGLVVYWDAIDNAGTGVHDPAATVWKNLGSGGSDYDLTIYHGAWVDANSLSNGICQLAAYGSTFYTYTTGEFAVDNYQNAYSGDDNTARYVFASKDRGLILGSSYAEFKSGTDGSITDFKMKDSGFHTLAYDHANAKPYLDGNAATVETRGTYGFDGWAGSAAGSPYNNKFFLGVNTAKAADFAGADYGRGFHGKYHAIRLYDRSLTADEIARNRTVDMARFASVVPVKGAVYIASSIAGLEGAEPNGVYFPDAWTFSAGTRTLRGFDWVCSGYQLQIWDATTSVWGTPTTFSFGGNEIAEWTSPVGSEFDSLRLVWLWKPVRGLRSAADYSAADYVSDGLAVCWDAIDNAGTNTHDPSAATWKNLGSGGDHYDLTIHHGVWSDGNSLSNGICQLAAYGSTFHAYHTGEFAIENYREAYSGDDNAARYVFASKNRGLILGTTYAQFQKKEGSNVSTTDFSMNTAGFHTLAYDIDNLQSYIDGALATISTKGTYGFDGASPYNNKFFLGVNTAKAADFAGADYGRGFHGKYHAIRLYDRSLAPEEIAWNRKVDAARFQGKLSATNVVVVANEYSGALDGPYEVLGSYTIEGSASSVDGKRPNQVRVWALQGDGSWGSSAVVNGESYTYVAGTSPSTVRIEFGRNVGLAIIVR